MSAREAVTSEEAVGFFVCMKSTAVPRRLRVRRDISLQQLRETPT